MNQNQTKTKINGYFEPNAAPVEVLNKKSTKRIVRVRFRNQADVGDFIQKTGIHVDVNKTRRHVYTTTPTLTDLFGI